jgi:hypothetical protein
MIPLWVWHSGFVIVSLIALTLALAYAGEVLARRRIERQWMQCMAELHRKSVIPVVAAFLIAGYAWAQTQIGTDQRSPKIPQVVEWGVCKDPVPNPTPNISCAGLEMMRFRYADGSTKVYTLVPATPNIATETKFVRVPLN